jgi:isopenicillin N synthase-like dioxygenase
MTISYDSKSTRAGSAAMPVIDLAPYLGRSRSGAAATAAEVRQACEALGVFGIVGHGVPGQVTSDIETVSREFFDLPAEEKRTYAPPSRLDYVGYYGLETLAAAATIGQSGPKDLFEAFSCGPYDDIRAPGDGEDRLFGRNIWPVRPAGLRTAWLRYYREMERLSGVLLRIFARALDLGDSWFEDRCGDHLSELIVNHYPPQDHPPLPGQIRQGAHTDFGTLTILRSSDGVPGLQVQSSGSWLDVPHVPDGFVVNVADLMTRWTNGLWSSPLHRVANPPAEYASRHRMTIPFFHNPAAGAIISPAPTTVTGPQPARFPPVAAGDWISEKLGRPPGARSSS